MGRYFSLSQPSMNTRDLTSNIVLFLIRTAYCCVRSALLLLIQKTQSPHWASWVARTDDTSAAPESFACLKAVLTSSASVFSSGGADTARGIGGDSFESNPAQPLAAKHKSIVNIGTLELPNCS